MLKTDAPLSTNAIPDINKIKDLLKKRVLVSIILSKSRLMEIIFNDLADTDRTDNLRQSNRTRIARFFAAVNMTQGGKKTIKKRRKTKRNKPNPKNKTKNKRKKQIKANKKQKRRTIKKNHKK
jgi:hypothetical protein